MKNFLRRAAGVIALAGAAATMAQGQVDTVNVMAYNVLNYGVYCQGPNAVYHNYLKTIVAYANPDIISLEKMGSIPMYAGDIHGILPIGFGDSILQFALNAAFPGRYAYCPFSNYAGANNISMLFYNQAKFGYVNTTFNYASTTDFNCYKLYYKDPQLAITQDTTFLYIIPNHDISGSSGVLDRSAQITGYMQQVQKHFSRLPNMISMGDFNLRYTTEPLYQTLTAPVDTDFRFFDPPFYPDGHLAYPANWDSNPASYTSYLTTSTRALATQPNSCGTSGGAKSWYDHIFISPWIIDNNDYIHYISNSYRTLGNDGHRLSISANDSTTVMNTSAPANVIEAIYQMSNKYPIMISLGITSNSIGKGPSNTEFSTAVKNVTPDEHIVVVNPVADKLIVYFPISFIGRQAQVLCYDAFGRVVMRQLIIIPETALQVPCYFSPGVYFVKIISSDICYQAKLLKK